MAMGLHQYDDLSGGVTGFAELLRLRGVGQREGFGDADLKLAVRDQLQLVREAGAHLLRRAGATHGGGDAKLCGAHVGYGDDAVGAAAEFDRLLQSTLARGVEHRVDALRCGFTDPLQQALAVRHRDRADRPHEVVVGGRRRTDDRGAGGLGELYGDRADRTSGSMQEESLAFLELQLVEDAPSRLARDRQADRLGPAHPGRLDCDVPDDRVLGVRAGRRPADYLVTDGELGIFADLVHDAGDLEPRRGREGGVDEALEPATADLEVHRVHPGRTNPNPDLPRSGVRLGYVLGPQHLGTAELLEYHRLHVLPPSIWLMLQSMVPAGPGFPTGRSDSCPPAERRARVDASTDVL